MTTSEQQTKNVSDISSGMVTLLATSTGLIVANLYYAQTLVGPISEATGLSAQAAGLIVTLTQIGYCLGLLFIVPLGDLVENRRLIFGQLLLTAAALAGAALANSPLLFLAASLGIGLGAVAAQILVPFAAHLTAESRRGQVVGKVTSGLLLGIMLARPAASLIADHLGWHTIYLLSAIITVSLAFLLRARLPIRQPAAALSYSALLRSMLNLLRTTPVLRRRAAYHAGMFAAFSLFWTTAPLALAGAGYHLSQSGIALFALVGVAGAVASPIAGRLADQGHTRLATAIALSLGLVGLAIPVLATLTGHLSRPAGIVLLAVASIILDMGVAANLVLGQRSLFVLGADIRSRLNGLYMAIFFGGGALGSALGGWMFANHGWQATLLTGMLFPAAALLYYLTEVFGRRS